MPEDDAVNFNCRHCGQPIEAPAEMRGTKTQCPTCGKTVKVQPTNLKVPLLIRFVYFGLCFVALWVVVTSASIPFLLLSGGLLSPANTHHPAQAKIPITGAFGFTLGEKLPEEYELKNGYSYVDLTNAPPFASVQVACLSDRTIYTIIGHGYSNLTEVVQALELKYGPGSFDYDKNHEYHRWTNSNCSLEADEFQQNSIEVKYINNALQDKSFDEDHKASHDVATNLAPKL